MGGIGEQIVFQGIGAADPGDQHMFVAGLQDGDKGQGIDLFQLGTAQKNMEIKKIPNGDLKDLVCQHYTQIRGLGGSDPCSQIFVFGSQFIFQHPNVEDLKSVQCMGHYSPLAVETEKNILKKSIKIKYIPRTIT